MANIGYIQVSRMCNQKCIFCSAPERPDFLPPSDIVDMIDDMVDRDYVGIIFTGGEPTLYEHLPEVMAHASERGVQVRMITNAQKIANKRYLKELVDAGLNHVNISTHSHIPEVHNELVKTPNSLALQAKAFDHLGEFGVPTNVNTVINQYNADHLHKLVEWIVTNWPHVNHFVWNNIDPVMNRAARHEYIVSRLGDMEVSLNKAMRYLAAHGKTFRAEKVPLCYMTEFAHFSTETRKIVKQEERTVHFLDEKGEIRQNTFFHHHGQACKVCNLKEICAGLYDMGNHYDETELYPVFVDKEAIKERILGAERYRQMREAQEAESEKVPAAV